MKKMLLVLIGLAPLLIGFILDAIVTHGGMASPVVGWVCVLAFPVLWFWVGFACGELVENKLQAAVLTHLAAGAFAVLGIGQTVLASEYLASTYGALPQLFYLPLSVFAGIFALDGWWIYLIGLIVMPIIFYRGVWYKYTRKAR